MKHSPLTLFTDNSEDVLVEDEIDELFSQLLHVEPPPTLVASILASVASLPRPQEISSIAWNNVGELIVQQNMQQPS